VLPSPSAPEGAETGGHLRRSGLCYGRSVALGAEMGVTVANTTWSWDRREGSGIPGVSLAGGPGFLGRVQ